MSRIAKETRKTKETDITLELNMDGTGQVNIETGIGFFDHMLTSFTRHGLFDLNLVAKGDLFVDAHHTVEDVGIVLGTAMKQALQDKKGIKRYGNFYMPMDDALILCAIDLSGRPYLSYDVNYTVPAVGAMDTELVEEFFRAVAYSAGMNIHIKQISGTNNHHLIEAVFKGFAKALDEATLVDVRIKDIMSTKGMI